MSLERIQEDFKLEGYSAIINPESPQADRAKKRYQKLFPEYNFEEVLYLTREDTGAVLALVIIKKAALVATRYRLIPNASIDDTIALANHLNVELVDVSMKSESGERIVLPTATNRLTDQADAVAIIATQKDTIVKGLDILAGASKFVNIM